MIIDKTILILGAGQIGKACAAKLIAENPKKIILHTLTKQEAIKASESIKRLVRQTRTKVKIFTSWGNILVPNDLMYDQKEDLTKNFSDTNTLIDFYFSCLSDKLLKNSALYQIIKKWKPNIIIDAVNTATVVGYQDDPYSLPREIIKKIDRKENIDWKVSCIKLLTSSIIPPIIRFTQALQKGIEDFKVEKYIKVSTTGLGGMGVNLFYTHGDINEIGMSSGILGKVATAGVIHQLFWSLSHTPGLDIKIIVPATLVGWEKVQFDKFRSRARNPLLIDYSKKINLKNGENLKLNKCKKARRFMKIPFVDSGENSSYSLGEMEAITSLGQMECITKEEVARAVLETAKGSTKYDLLTAMDYATLTPSFLAAIQRQIVFDELRRIEKDKKIPSIATNNLGPTVSKHLFELYILLQISDDSIEKLIETKSKDLIKKTEKFIESHKEIRSQILSLGLPIIFNDKKLLIGEICLVPDVTEKNIISSKNIDKWAEIGWVDLRENRINYWQKWIRKLWIEFSRLEKKAIPVLNRNWQNVKNGKVGEILGYIYSLQNGERKK